MSTMNPEAFERAVARACLRKATSWSPAMLLGTDAAAVSFGPVLDEIVHEAGVPAKQVKRQLKTLEAAGRVLVDGAGTKRTWWVVGLIDTWKRTTEVVIPATALHATPSWPSAAAPSIVATRQRDVWWEVLGVNQDDSFRECTAAYRRQLAEIMGDTDANEAEANAAMQRLKTAYDGAAKAHEVQVTE